ncbi:MAG TPA: FAD binding domain-containing protein [Streptosporangiaceae bacterium]|nr:FAD binding domain-containing protein [Streptosporangiaceae bacterium]
MKLPPFTLHRPESVGQASRLLADLGDEGAAYCGGTELLLAMKLGLASYEHLVDLKRVGALRGITQTDGYVRIGAASTHREIETSAALRAAYPELCTMISQVANVRVRSAGTLGGNLCFADPHSDPASFLMAAGAVMTCQRGDTTRRIPAAGFLTGPYQTALAPGELLTAVELPPRPDRGALSHLRFKLTERPAVTVTALLTLAAAGSASPAVATARLVVGSVGSVPFAAGTAILAGAAAGDFEARAAACAEQAAAGCAVLPDGEASADYLRHLVFVHARQALREAFTRAS